MDWCIVLVKMPLTRFEECWPLPTESLPELPKNLNIVFLVDCLSSGNPMHVDYASAVKKKKKQKKTGSSKVCGWICSVWPSWVWESQHASTGNSVSWSLGHSTRSSFHRMTFFPNLKQNFIAYRSTKVQFAFLKFTSCDNQALVGCIPFPAVVVHLNLKSSKLVSHHIRCLTITY